MKIKGWWERILQNNRFTMKQEEEIAKRYLDQQGLGYPFFEPDGKIPPDFVFLPQQIAIEVRRLNRFLAADNHITEENIYIPFHKKIVNALNILNSQYFDKSYLIIIDYSFPLPFPLPKFDAEEISKNIKSIISLQDNKFPNTLKISDGISLTITELPKKGKQNFYLGSGGIETRNIHDLYIEGLKWCIIDKSNKIKKYKQKYLEWQLLLVDTMRWDLHISDINKIKASITDLGLFDSLVVIGVDAKFLFCKKN